MKILLVSPRWAGFGNRKKIKVREHEVHPLTLGIIAALSDTHDVRIVDEHVEAIPFTDEWDLVGITCTTYVAPRAYEIADQFRTHGVPVVMGGVHATLMPEECLEHCDAVVRGEAEPVWEQVLHDASRRGLAGLYEGDAAIDLAVAPIPRRELFHNPRQPAAYVQMTRGCGWTCRFCYLQHVGWGTFRTRPLERVMVELATIDQRVLLIVDDNLFVDREYALALFAEMEPLRKFWWAQAPVTACFDDELLDAAFRSGCFSLSVGFQTVSKASLEEAQIAQNRVDQYCEAVRNLHRHRILVDGTFIFGFDADPPTVFDDTVEAVRDMRLDSYTFYMLTPYPGTEFFRQYEQEGRIVDRNWSHYDWDHAVIRPERMSAEELTKGVARAYQKLDSSWLRWALRGVVHRGWALTRSAELTRFLIRQNWPSRYAVDY